MWQSDTENTVKFNISTHTLQKAIEQLKHGKASSYGVTVEVLKALPGENVGDRFHAKKKPARHSRGMDRGQRKVDTQDLLSKMVEIRAPGVGCTCRVEHRPGPST